MRSICLPLVFLALVLGVSPACAPIRFASQEILLRHDPKADTLDVLLMYSAIQEDRKSVVWERVYVLV